MSLTVVRPSILKQMNMTSQATVDASDAYVYEPFHDSGQQEIRLLWLRPAESVYDLIECDLQVFPLQVTPEYVRGLASDIGK
jgi:hypothetical protein